jgi:hypothetical protein
MSEPDAEIAALRAKLADAERHNTEVEAALADAEAALADAEAARADAERRATAAGAALQEAADVPAALEAAVSYSYSAVLTRLSKLVIASPSKASQAERALRPALASFGLDEPLVLSGAPPREALENAFSGVQQLGRECVLYSLATFGVPACVTARARTAGAKINAEAMYGPRTHFELPNHVDVPLKCEPELEARVNNPGDPAFAGEVKSQAPAIMLNEVVTYVMLCMMDSCFRVDAARRGRRFHAAPPVGYALVALAHVGYLVGVEWVGKLLVRPISQPFFLGSPQHTAAVKALSVTPLPTEGVVVVPDADGTTWCTHPPTGPPLVSWTHTRTPGGRFWKVIESTAFDKHPEGGAARLRALFRVHAAYAAALARWDAASDDPPPRALVPARLCYGAFAVLVDMPFVGDRGATDAELQCRGPVLAAVAAAVCWLARRGLLYIDLRALNVRCPRADAAGAEQCAWLVDYDDMLLLSQPARNAEELLAALARDEHGAAALRSLPALAEALRTEWRAPVA